MYLPYTLLYCNLLYWQKCFLKQTDKHWNIHKFHTSLNKPTNCKQHCTVCIQYSNVLLKYNEWHLWCHIRKWPDQWKSRWIYNEGVQWCINHSNSLWYNTLKHPCLSQPFTSPNPFYFPSHPHPWKNKSIKHSLSTSEITPWKHVCPLWARDELQY